MLPGHPAADLVRAFGWALVGFALHFVVAAKKQLDNQLATGGDSPTLGNWLLLLHVLYLRVILAEALVVAATVAAVVATHGSNVFTLIAAGYSFDSVGELALKKSLEGLGKRTELITAPAS